MNEKTKVLLNNFLNELPESCKPFFQAIAEHAVSLGYFPKKTKTKNFNLDFSNGKLKQTLLKLEAPNPKEGNGIPGIRLKFYASKHYSDIFQEGIRAVIEQFDGKYTGCYGCGKCKHGLRGYTYEYPDGKNVFRCGFELIPIKGWTQDHLSEIKQLMNRQHDEWQREMAL